MSLEGWMAVRWLDVINELPELRKVVRRGKVLARKRAVEQLEVVQGLVSAECKDDGGSVYSVRIRQIPLQDEVWDEVLDQLAADASHAAALLAGGITEGCAEVFDLAGVDLFPFDVRDMTTFCTCSNEGLLCRHAAATHFALALAIELDPFLLFVFRGISRDGLLDKLRERRGVPSVAGAGEEARSPGAVLDIEAPDALLSGYWERGVVPHLAFRLEADAEGANGDAAAEALPILRALGAGPGGLSADEVIAILAPIVTMARKRVAELVVHATAADAPLAETGNPSTEALDDILVAAAHQHGELTTAFVSEAMGITKIQARKYLQWLVEEGRLTVEGKARATKYLPV